MANETVNDSNLELVSASSTSTSASTRTSSTTSTRTSSTTSPALNTSAPIVMSDGLKTDATVQELICTSRLFEGTRQTVDEDESSDLSGVSRCCLSMFVLLAQLLLNGVLILCIYWIVAFHSTESNVFLAWNENPQIQFNWHPLLMILGLIYFVGQAMLTYRTCRCCKRIWNKLLHTLFHILAIPCVVIAFMAVLDSHNLRKDKDNKPAPIPNFYSLHSWMGLATMGLFALQFVVGFFSFLLLLCCESATASFRSRMVPIHASFGVTTFVMAVATACSGLTEKAFFTLSIAYSKWVPYLFSPTFEEQGALEGANMGPDYTESMLLESLTINAMAAFLIVLAIVVPFVVSYSGFRRRSDEDDYDDHTHVMHLTHHHTNVY